MQQAQPRLDPQVVAQQIVHPQFQAIGSGALGIDGDRAADVLGQAGHDIALRIVQAGAGQVPGQPDPVVEQPDAAEISEFHEISASKGTYSPLVRFSVTPPGL